MKADPFVQLKLLDVQELDSQLDALRHQVATLPEHAELAALAAARAESDEKAKDLRVVVDDLTREQRKAEADVEQVRARRERDQARLDSGQGNPKDLERLQHEMVSLARRITELEDVELEVMERLEDAQNELDAAEATMAEIMQKGSATQRARDEQTAALQRRISEIADERKITASGVNAELLELYDKLRGSKDGVGVSALRQRRCGGCGLELSPADLNSIRATPVDDVVRCEECSRILVRTAESGL